MSDLVIKLTETYEFEGKKYDEIDLTGLEGYKYKDLRTAKKTYRLNGGTEQIFITDDEFCMCVAAQIIGQPPEFFDELDAGTALQVYSKVTAELGKKFQETQN